MFCVSHETNPGLDRYWSKTKCGSLVNCDLWLKANMNYNTCLSQYPMAVLHTSSLGKCNAILYILGIHNDNSEVIESTVWWICMVAFYLWFTVAVGFCKSCEKGSSEGCTSPMRKRKELSCSVWDEQRLPCLAQSLTLMRDTERTTSALNCLLLLKNMTTLLFFILFIKLEQRM